MWWSRADAGAVWERKAVSPAAAAAGRVTMPSASAGRGGGLYARRLVRISIPAGFPRVGWGVAKR